MLRWPRNRTTRIIASLRHAVVDKYASGKRQTPLPHHGIDYSANHKKRVSEDTRREVRSGRVLYGCYLLRMLMRSGALTLGCVILLCVPLYAISSRHVSTRQKWLNLPYFFTLICFSEATTSWPSGLTAKSTNALVSLSAFVLVTTL